LFNKFYCSLLSVYNPDFYRLQPPFHLFICSNSFKPVPDAYEIKMGANRQFYMQYLLPVNYLSQWQVHSKHCIKVSYVGTLSHSVIHLISILSYLLYTSYGLVASYEVCEFFVSLCS